MANILHIDRDANKITLGTTGTTINIASHTASKILALDGSKDLEVVTIGTSLNYARPTLNTIQDIRTTASPEFAGGTFTGVVTGVIPTAGDHFATKEYVDLALGAFKTFFLSNTGSGVGALNYAYPHETDEGQSTIVNDGGGEAYGAGEHLVQGFITEVGEPATTTIHEGVIAFHFHAKKGNSNQRITTLQAILSRVDADGTTGKTTIATTEISEELTDTELDYEIHATLTDDVEIASTARLILDVYANVGAGAQDAVITLYMEGTEDSYFTTKVDSGIWQNYGAVLDDLNTLGTVGADSEFLVGTGAGAFAWESGATVRTSIGLGTGDSPQFAAINLGHASDTTITRVSAGVIAVEGTTVMLVGGAPTAHVHDGDTLQHDSINSNGGAFSFTTSGTVTFSQSITMSAGKDLTIAGHIIFNTNNSFIGFADPRITFNDNDNQLDITGKLVLPDDGYLGSASMTTALQIDSSGNIALGSNLNINSGIGEITCGSINKAANTLTLEIAGTPIISILSTNVNFSTVVYCQQGNLNCGVSDNTAGVLVCYGGASGTYGGRLYLYTNADADTDIDVYHIRVEDDDLHIGDNANGNIITIAGIAGNVSIATILAVEGASVTVGKASTTTGTLVLHDSNSANTITLTVPDISAGSLTFTLPPTDGDNTNVLQTDGNGVLTWVAAGGAGADEKVKIDSGATAGYIGAANSDGVLRTGASLSYTDGGDFVTINTIQNIQTSANPQFAGLGLGVAATAGTLVVRSSGADGEDIFVIERSTSDLLVFNYLDNGGTDSCSLELKRGGTTLISLNTRDTDDSYFNIAGGLAIGGTDAKTKLTVEGTLTLKEQAAADGDTTAYGQFWVKNNAPCIPMFTNDVGTDFQLGKVFGDFTDEDDDGNAMLKAQAYLANQDGFVTAYATQQSGSESLIGYIDSDTNPASGGSKIAQWTDSHGSMIGTITFRVQSGKYFEITWSGSSAATIFWHPVGILIKCTDQD